MQMVLQQRHDFAESLSAVGRGMPVVFEERLQRDFEVAWRVASPHCLASVALLPWTFGLKCAGRSFSGMYLDVLMIDTEWI